jgi:nickel superoxide dismutase
MKKQAFKTARVLFLVMVCSVTVWVLQAGAHCQIPCGIYDDHMRVAQMMEDSETILKSCRMMAELSGKTDVQSQNQMIRWVMTKEVHAQKVILAISDYFLTQRVKESQPDYLERLKRHHAVIVAAMKAKQNADEQTAQALQRAIQDLAGYYPAHKE